jgi:(4-(4-[2-(gamma-L-glutamylamino)ethyl]phenoxymethyl)furan-2-yl)methanamine synthase
MSVLGLDVGGANLKAAHSSGACRSLPFPLWKNPHGLAPALRQLTRALPPFERVAVTMTGELCDCFETKRQGVHAILDAVEDMAEGKSVLVWRNDERFGSVAESRAEPLAVAAANWLALAFLAGRHAGPGPALLLDVGSTTTDVIPLLEGRPTPLGRTDPERLRSRELVYTGARRTPLCALLGGDGAAEFFATTLDVYLVLGELPDDPADTDTADGRPATQPYAHARLARMFCADAETSTTAERLVLAGELRERQRELLTAALGVVTARLPGPPRTVVVAGSGEFIAAATARRCPATSQARLISLGQGLGPTASTAACAVAVATLAGEEG